MIFDNINPQHVSHSEPSVGLLLALHSQHQRISVGQGETELMVLPLAVFGCIDHSALGQQQVHIGGCVLGALIALKKTGHMSCCKSKTRNGITEACECIPNACLPGVYSHV